MKRILILGVCAVLSVCAGAKTFTVKSPSGNNVVTLEAGHELLWSIEHDGQRVLEPSVLSMTLDNDLYYCLAPECRLDDTSWIEPGNCAWEWWNGMNVAGVSFRVGSNTETYCHYADFAAEYGLDYVLLDGGWSGTSLKEGHSGLNLPAIVRHAGEKGVGVFDRTVVLDGKIGEYIVVARQKDGVWYVGAMTNRSARDIEIDFSFLEKPGKADIFSDGINADRNGKDYLRGTAEITPSTRMTVSLSTGGGWAAIIE